MELRQLAKENLQLKEIILNLTARLTTAKKKSELRDMREDYQVDLSYKQEVAQFVQRQKSLGVSRSKVLVDLAISSSTYYSWKKLIEQGPKEKKLSKPHPAKLTPSEKQLIVATKRENPDKRHRHIQKLIQSCSIYISPS